MEPLTHNCGGSVIDTFALGPTGTMQKPNFVIFHNGRREIPITVNTMELLTQNCGGSAIDTFALGPTGTV